MSRNATQQTVPVPLTAYFYLCFIPSFLLIRFLYLVFILLSLVSFLNSFVTPVSALFPPLFLIHTLCPSFSLVSFLPCFPLFPMFPFSLVPSLPTLFSFLFPCFFSALFPSLIPSLYPFPFCFFLPYFSLISFLPCFLFLSLFFNLVSFFCFPCFLYPLFPPYLVFFLVSFLPFSLSCSLLCSFLVCF